MRKQKVAFQIISALSLMFVLLIAAFGSGCGQHATEGAAKGATVGAASSAVGTLVVGLVFNDPNLGERVARSAVYGATVGGTAGAIAGASRDQQIKTQAKAQEEKAKAEGGDTTPPPRQMKDSEIMDAIGEKNFDALVLLVDCRLGKAIEKAREAEASFNKDYREASLWIQAVAAVEKGDTATLDRVYPLLVKADPELGTPEKADAALATALNKLRDARKREGKPPECPSS
jgi:hypothetical protein